MNRAAIQGDCSPEYYGSVVRCGHLTLMPRFKLRRQQVPERFQRANRVPPASSFQGRHLNGLLTARRPVPLDHFTIEHPDDGLGQSDIARREAIPDPRFSDTSGENRVRFIITTVSHENEPPANPWRFSRSTERCEFPAKANDRELHWTQLASSDSHPFMPGSGPSGVAGAVPNATSSGL